MTSVEGCKGGLEEEDKLCFFFLLCALLLMRLLTFMHLLDAIFKVIFNAFRQHIYMLFHYVCSLGIQSIILCIANVVHINLTSYDHALFNT